MKNLLCKFGWHRPSKKEYLVVTRFHRNGKKYHGNYRFCERCGKRLHRFTVKNI